MFEGFQESKEFIATYEPFAELKIPEVILLIEQVGAGKSSLFNTINSIFKGGMSSRACSGSVEKGITKKFELESGASTKTPGFVKEPTVREKIHVVVSILDGSNLNFLSKDVGKKLREIKSLVFERGVPHLVFFSKIDEICELVKDDVRKVYKSKTVEDAVNKAADLFAIPRSNVLLVKNYEKEFELQTSINIMAQMALQKSLMFADDFLENQYELKQEKTETLDKQD